MRHLGTDEIVALESLGNVCASWGDVSVAENFVPSTLRGCTLSGHVSIGKDTVLEYSTVKDCVIGDSCVIRRVGHLEYYSIGNCSTITDVDLMCSDMGASFGCGVPIAVANENGSREIRSFEGMTVSDACLWAEVLKSDNLADAALHAMTASDLASDSAEYASVGEGCGIRSVRTILNTRIGDFASVEGASRLEDVTLHSSLDESSVVEDNVVLRRGIVGYGCRVLAGCVAERFVLGECCTLEYGARLVDSVLGDNSTVACCEVRSSLIFPGHEQHHNNSFLIAACIGGQSNIAAGATLGSNHSSRAADGELIAGRGFWPGLCVSVKLPSRFAPYTLLVKGSYPYELDMPLPFSLVSNNEKEDTLEVLPAYWWRCNMYALVRNACKYRERDCRRRKVQHMETDCFAPDSMAAVFRAMGQLLSWGNGALQDDEGVVVDGIENSRRRVVVRRPLSAYRAYSDMIVHYAAKNLLEFLRDGGDVAEVLGWRYDGAECASWVNLGGQMIDSSSLESLAADLKSGRVTSWDEVHAFYDKSWAEYPMARLAHAMHLLCELWGENAPGKDVLLKLADEERRIVEFMRLEVRRTREKDLDSPFRLAPTKSSVEDDAFVQRSDRDAAQAFEKLAVLEGLLR